MSTPLIPQEIYLLERYSSLAYFGALRDHFAAMVKAADDALASFMQNLPSDYRSRPLHEQPDAVWGERVLPNLRWTLDGLNAGYIRISHGDFEALGVAGNVKSAFASISRDYPIEWMPQPHLDVCDQEWRKSSRLASNINITALCEWRQGSLSAGYTDQNRGPLNAPATWPQYRLNPSVQVSTDAKVPRSGIYLPSTSHSTPQLLIEGYDAWGATVLKNPGDPEDQRFNRVPTVWTLVERAADSGGGIPGTDDTVVGGVRLRCEAGQPCPREGFWFTPAQVNSRRKFKQGDVMPEVRGSYGATIWQWDDGQH